jgi:hypothetical protein
LEHAHKDSGAYDQSGMLPSCGHRNAERYQKSS